MSDIFISYAREDKKQVQQLAIALERTGWSVFWDLTIPPGQMWREYIGSALEQARCVVVAWSATSIKSSWVLEEADVGREREILIPVFFEQISPPLGFRSIQAADLSGWDGSTTSQAFSQLIEAVQSHLGPSPADAEAKRKAELKRQQEEQRRAEEEAQRIAKKEAELRAAETKRQAELKRQQEEESEKSSGNGTSHKPGQVFRDTLKDGSKGPEMAVIPAGSFEMGSDYGPKNGYYPDRCNGTR